MRKRDQPPQYFFTDIFEPPPPWPTTVAHSNNSGNNPSYHGNAHRSPIHHHPSLSEIVYQDYSNTTEIQDGNLVEKK